LRGRCGLADRLLLGGAGSSLVVVTATSGPGASRGAGAPPREAGVEYRLVRDALVRDVRRGKVDRVDVCDAHPELLRAARNVGRPTDDDCPICEAASTVEVTFVFGARLPPGGRCPGSRAELDRLRRRADPVTCYAVEVCPSCAWHHLTRRYPAGGRASASAARSRV
jgi:hypothetical protein